jgi:hypothetical protein
VTPSINDVVRLLLRENVYSKVDQLTRITNFLNQTRPLPFECNWPVQLFPRKTNNRFSFVIEIPMSVSFFPTCFHVIYFRGRNELESHATVAAQFACVYAPVTARISSQFPRRNADKRNESQTNR